MREYFFFYLLLFSQLLGVYFASELESILLFKKEEELSGKYNGATEEISILKNAKYVTAFSADVSAKTLYYYDERKKAIFSKTFQEPDRNALKEFSYNLDGLFHMEYESVDNNLYYGITKEFWSSIVVCTTKGNKQCSIIVTEEEGKIKSFTLANRDIVILVERSESIEIKRYRSNDNESLHSIKTRPRYLSNIAYDTANDVLVWGADKYVYRYHMNNNELEKNKTTHLNFKFVAYFEGKIILFDEEDGDFLIQGEDFEKKQDIGIVSAITTSTIDRTKSNCDENKCNDDKICISSKHEAVCVCPVFGSLRNCKDLANEEVAIGVLISRSNIIQFYPDSSGIFHYKNVYKFSETYNNLTGDYYIKENSFIYSISAPDGFSEFYKINLNKQEKERISRLENTQVKSLSVDQITGNIYISTNFGIRVLTENGKWGRFKSEYVNYDFGQVFTDPFQHSVLFFSSHKYDSQTSIREMQMDMKKKSQKLFYYDPLGIFGIEIRKDYHVISGHVKYENATVYKIIVDSEMTTKSKEALLSKQPNNVNSHYDQLFYSVDDKLYTHNLNNHMSEELLSTGDEIQLLRIFTKELHTIKSETNLCDSERCSDVCIMKSKDETKCICPSHEFLNDDKKTCFSPNCDFNTEYWCDNKCKELDRDYCDDFGYCDGETDEFDCEHEGWLKNYCKDTEIHCQKVNGISCLDKEIYCIDGHPPECINTVNMTEICKDFSECKNDQFKCSSSYHTFAHCIEQSNVCNGQQDCHDGSDEKNCKECKDTEFSCLDNQRNSICIYKEKLCDGKKDCFNGKDEDFTYCSDYCLKNDMFRCDEHSCVRKKDVCNGLSDCLNGEDEKDCKVCEVHEVTCKNFIGQEICAPKCDGNKDCRDGSDEKNCCKDDQVQCSTPLRCINHDDWCSNSYTCNLPINLPNCPEQVFTASTTEFTSVSDTEDLSFSNSPDRLTSDASTQQQKSTLVPLLSTQTVVNCSSTDERLCANGQQCIKMKSFCDGFHDCLDESDEAEDLCKIFDDCKRSCKNGKCRLMTDDTARCECNHGFTLTSENQCEDIDECNGKIWPCDQICTNTEGHFECSCVDGYTKKANGICDAGHDPLFYIVTKYGIKMMSKKATFDEVTLDSMSHISAVTGKLNNLIYSAVKNEKSSTIYKQIHDKEFKAVKEFSNSIITGLAYDWFNDNVYYSEYKPDKEMSIIGVCNFEGGISKCKALRNEKTRVTQIVVDPIEGNIYWVKWSGKFTIQKADIGISHDSMRTLFDTDLETQPLLAIDYATNFVYAYYDAKIHRIEDPSHNHKKIRSQEMRLSSPRYMDLFQNEAYFGVQNDIMKYSLRIREQETVFTDTDKIDLIFIGHKLRHLTDSKEHEKACHQACLPKEICLMKSKGASCESADEIHTIEKPPTTTTTTEETQTEQPTTEPPRNSMIFRNNSLFCSKCKNGECFNRNGTLYCKCYHGHSGLFCEDLNKDSDKPNSKFRTAIIVSCVLGFLIIVSSVLAVVFWDRLKRMSRKPLKICAGLTSMIFRRGDDERNLVKNPGFVENIQDDGERDPDRYMEMSYNAVGNDMATSDEPTVQLIIR